MQGRGKVGLFAQDQAPAHPSDSVLELMLQVLWKQQQWMPHLLSGKKVPKWFWGRGRGGDRGGLAVGALTDGKGHGEKAKDKGAVQLVRCSPGMQGALDVTPQ